MLRLRVLTAAVLAPLFVLGVLKLSSLHFALLTGLVILLGAWEWTGLADGRDRRLRSAGVVVTALLMAAVHHYRGFTVEPVLVVACGAWLVVVLLLVQRRGRALLTWPGPACWTSGILVLLPAWLATSTLQSVRPEAAVMLFLLIWGADTAAYFVGRRWGRRKLAPAISPGKTLEGVLAAAGAAVPVAGVFAAYWSFSAGASLALILWSVAVVLVSVFGDLFESNWKRLAEMKDSGGLLPGHGGVLDRIDSLTAAAPFFTLGWLWWFGHASA